MSDIRARYDAAREIADKAGDEALRYFRAFESLKIDKKGHQDLVSEGDRNVELLVRAEITAAFPDDGIVGEEHDMARVLALQHPRQTIGARPPDGRVDRRRPCRRRSRS